MQAAELWAGGLQSAHIAYMYGAAKCFSGENNKMKAGITMLKQVPSLPEQSQDLRDQLVKLASDVRKEICHESTSTSDSGGGPLPLPARSSKVTPNPKVVWSGTAMKKADAMLREQLQHRPAGAKP